MNNYFVEPTDEELILAHHGILGQRWGVRRYQNADGSLTEAGRRKYGSEENLKKIQDAKADAKAYKIRSKAKAKAIRKINNEELKAQKKTNKEQKKVEEKMRAEKEARQKEYKRKQMISNLTNDVFAPAAKEAARSALINIADKKMKDLLTDPETKKYNAEFKAWERKANIANKKRQFTADTVYINENSYKTTNEYGRIQRDKSAMDANNDLMKTAARNRYTYEMTTNDKYATMNKRSLDSKTNRLKTLLDSGKIQTNSSNTSNNRPNNQPKKPKFNTNSGKKGGKK